MEKKIKLYYQVIDLLEEINDLEKVIAAYKDSKSGYSKIQYSKLQDKYLLQLKSLLGENNIDINQLLKVGGNQEANFYLLIVNNAEYLLADIKSKLLGRV